MMFILIMLLYTSQRNCFAFALCTVPTTCCSVVAKTLTKIQQVEDNSLRSCNLLIQFLLCMLMYNKELPLVPKCKPIQSKIITHELFSVLLTCTL